MRPCDLLNLLKSTIPAKLPVLIKGAPGVGKSDIVARAAESCESDLVVSHPVVSDPTDFKGLPGIVNGKAEFLPFGDLRCLLEAKKLTVAFLDDLGQAPPVVQAAAMQLILARRVNGHRVSDHVVFIAATNRKEDRAGVSGILEPVKSRFSSIVELTVHVDDWIAWALENDVPEEVLGFIRFRPELLLSGTPSADIVNRPCPRTITYLGKLWNLGIRNQEALAGAVGTAFATEFLGFVRVWEELPTLDQIREDPMTARVPTNTASLFALSMMLTRRSMVLGVNKLFMYLSRLPDEYQVLIIKGMEISHPGSLESGAYTRWCILHPNLFMPTTD